MEGFEAIFVACLGGTHDGTSWPMHPTALMDGAQRVLPSSKVAALAMLEAPEREPVSSPPDNTWERYVVRHDSDGWVLLFDGRLDDVPPQAVGAPDDRRLADPGLRVGHANLPPPGWYRLPFDASRQNYWDGSEWTDRARPAEAYTRPFPR